MKNLPTTKSKLSKLEQEFVRGLIITGGNLTHAMQHTSYKGKNASAQASNIWRNIRVKEAYKAAIRDKLERATGTAVNSLVHLAESAESEHVQLAAANAILDRTGFKQLEEPGKQGAVTVNINLGSDTGATQTVDDNNQVIDLTADSSGIDDVDVS